MDNLIGKQIFITGMTIEVIADADDKWECLNLTTKDTVMFKKTVIEGAIKLGKAEVISEDDNC